MAAHGFVHGVIQVLYSLGTLMAAAHSWQNCHPHLQEACSRQRCALNFCLKDLANFQRAANYALAKQKLVVSKLMFTPM